MIASGLHEIRAVFDLMPTEGEEAWANIDARLAAVPAALDGYRDDPAARPPTQGHVVGHAPARRGRRPGAQLDRPGRAATTSSPASSAGCDVDGRCAAQLERARRGAASDAFADVRPLPRRRARAARPRARRPSAASATRSARATSSAPRSTSRRPTPGAGRSSSGIEDEMARGRRPDRARRLASTRRSPRSTPTRPARISGTEAFRDWMQELADRTLDEHGRHALRHPGADPPDRVLPRPDQRRRHLLHRPERGLHPPRPDVVVGARRHRRASPPGARSPPSSTRACPATTCRSRQTAYRSDAAQPLAAADVLGLRPRRGLGAVRRAADGRARLPRRPGRQARHARRPGASGRPG